MTLYHEEFVFVAGVCHDEVLIAWGRFPIEEADGSARVVDQSESSAPGGFVGAGSASCGWMRIRVWRDGDSIDSAIMRSTKENHVRISGLLPDTQYRYLVDRKIGNNDRPWGNVQRRFRYNATAGKHVLTAQKVVDPERGPFKFQTFPDPSKRTPKFRFMVIGDPGSGIDRVPDDSHALQAAVARVMTARFEQVTDPPVRFILALGDLIYNRSGKGALFHQIVSDRFKRDHDHLRGSGNEDDEWYYSFFEPYRDLLMSVPVFPALGNHDTNETEVGDDRDQVLSNLYLTDRFGPNGMHRRASHTSGAASGDIWNDGLFYDFAFGRDFRFVALDTTGFKREPLRAPINQNLIQSLRDPSPGWIIPFGHHPPFSQGPSHEYDKGDVRRVRHILWKGEASPLRGPSVRASFWGHEHNYQHFSGVFDSVQRHFFVSGAAGKSSKPIDERKGYAKKASKKGWPLATADFDEGGHFLDCTYDNGKLTVLPIRTSNRAADPVTINE